MKSFVMHTRSRTELIIADNGDERQTNYFKNKFHPYKHLVFGENKGISYARNTGAEHARGEYLCFIDSDLIYRRYWLGSLRNLLERHVDEKLIATGIHGEVMRANRWRCRKQRFTFQIWSRAPGGCLLMSKETWNTVGPWPDTWRLGFDFCTQAARKGYSFIVPVPDVVRQIDEAPSYNKRLLAKSYKEGKPEWKVMS
jgi:glycosyltransferase involved in cell wall biosynthesis